MSYLRDRLLQAAVTMYAIVTLAYFLNRSMPGGPVEFLREEIRQNPDRYGLPQNPTEEEVNRAIEQMINLPPDEPIMEAYVNYMIEVFLYQDLGESIIIAPGADVFELIMLAAPWTIFLSVIALIYGLVVGIILGSVMAYYEGTKFDVGMTVAMIVNSGIPYYVAAIFLLYVFAFQLGWFPTSGRVDPNAEAGLNFEWITSVFYHAALPSLSFIVVGFGGGALGMRANSIRLLGSEYVRNAELRGLSTYRISVTYLARNAILPIWTSVVIGLGGILGGSVIMEMIFAYPGMGLLMFDAAIERDFPVLMGALVITTFLFVVGTIIADFTYPLIDPRADVKESRE